MPGSVMSANCQTVDRCQPCVPH